MRNDKFALKVQVMRSRRIRRASINDNRVCRFLKNDRLIGSRIASHFPNMLAVIPSNAKDPSNWKDPAPNDANAILLGRLENEIAHLLLPKVGHVLNSSLVRRWKFFQQRRRSGGATHQLTAAVRAYMPEIALGAITTECAFK